MAYNMGENTYTCDICGFASPWDKSDDIHGNMWSCEKCGNHFCSKCFIDTFGAAGYAEMMRKSHRVYCPACWEKHRTGI